MIESILSQIRRLDNAAGNILACGVIGWASPASIDARLGDIEMTQRLGTAVLRTIDDPLARIEQRPGSEQYQALVPWNFGFDETKLVKKLHRADDCSARITKRSLSIAAVANKATAAFGGVCGVDDGPASFR